MQDKEYMESILWDTKCLADLFLHGSIESSTEDVHENFLLGLKSVLKLQNEVYQSMKNKGWYSVEKAEQKKIDKVLQKFKKED